MSLTVTNNSVTQQQTLQPQLSAAPAGAAADSSATAAVGAAAPAAQANPAAALVSGNATLTSDLLSVLLQEQSGAAAATYGTGQDGGNVTLAGILDAQTIAEQYPFGASSGPGSDPTGDLLSMLTGQPATNNAAGLDAASLLQSGASTGSVLGGVQDLLTQLGA